MILSIVVIGRNEGERLRESLQSALAIEFPRADFEVLYVDSGSRDNSVKIAEECGVGVLRIVEGKMTAARARDLGWRQSKGKYIFFLDGDTVTDPAFPKKALKDFNDDRVGIVFGKIKERYPDRSYYNAVIGLDWNPDPGEAASCGGNALVRREALEKAGGFRTDLISGEEPEMCARVRRDGYKILLRDIPMAEHDLNICSFKQYFLRCFRTGYTYALLNWIPSMKEEGQWRRRSRHNIIKSFLFLVLMTATVLYTYWLESPLPVLAFLLAVGLLWLYTSLNAIKKGSRRSTGFLYGWHAHFQHFPMLLGQLSYYFDTLFRESVRGAIEYKADQRDLNVLYIGSSLPCRSETFVYREIFGLRRMGLSVFTASVHTPERGLESEELDRLAEETRVIYSRNLLRFISQLACELFFHPLRSFRTLSLALSLAVSPNGLRFNQRLKLVIQTLAALSTAGWARNKNISHIHAHMANTPTSIALFLSKQLDIPFSFTGHAADLFLNPVLLKEKLVRSTFISCISEWHRDYYKLLVPVEDGRLPVIRCGIDLQLFNTKPADSNTGKKIRIFSVGRLVPKKGFEYLINELERLQLNNQEWECLIVGEGPERGELESMIKASSQSSRVRLLGAKSNAEVLNLLRQSDIFVLPCAVDRNGDRDGIPVALLEAMACGLPVVAGDLPTIHEAIKNHESGLIIDPRKPGELRDSLTDLANSPEKRSRIGNAARKAVLKKFSLELNLEKLARYFRIQNKPESSPEPQPKSIDSSLLLISPCKDEARFLEKTIHSVLNQTLKPALWIIIDDGSTDETPKLLTKFASEHDWIRVVRKDSPGQRNVGPGVIEAFYTGLETVETERYDFICKLDLDLILPSKYFEILLDRMRRNPRIGTCSGKSYFLDERTGRYFREPCGDEMSAGMIKLYRMQCFKEIGGFIKSVMWDGIDCHRCRMLGWIACSWDEEELRFAHLRAMGSSQQGILTGRMRHGAGQYFMGTGLAYIGVSSLYRMLHPPYIIGGFGIIAGYINAMAKSQERYRDKEFRLFLKDYQKRCLLLGKKKATERVNDEKALAWLQNRK